MKILRVDKFQSKKRSKKKGLNSATPEAKEEYTRIDEELENRSTDGYAEQNVSPDLKLQTEDESQAKVDAEPEGVSDKLSKAYARKQYDPEPEVFPEPQPGEPSEKSPQNETKTQNLTNHGLQTFFESLPDENPEPLSKNMNLSNNLSDHKPKENLEHISPEEHRTNFATKPGQEQRQEEDQKSVETEETPVKNTASIRPLRHFDMKTVSTPKEEDEERPKRKKKDSGGSGGDITARLSFSLRDIFHVLFKHKMQILVLFAAVVVAVTVGTFLTKPTYEASAKILVKMGRESIFMPAAGNMNPIINYNSEERINSEMEILKSPSLAEKVVSVLGPTALYEDLKENETGFIHRIMSWILLKEEKQLTSEERAALNLKIASAILQKNLNIEGIQKSNIIQLSFQHQDPQMVALVVNQLSDVYFDQHLQVHKTPKSHEFFQEQSELLKNKLEQSEQQLEALKKQHNITSLEQERTLLLEQASALRTDQNTTSSQIVETEKRIYQLRQQFGSTQKTIPQVEETIQNQQLISTLQARLVELELKEKELMAKYTDQSRLVQNVKDEIRVLKEKLADPENKSYGTTKFGMNPTYQKLQVELLSNEANLNALKAKAETQKSQLAAYQGKLEEFNRINVELNQLQQQIDVNRQNYRLYLSKFEESRISNAMDTEKITSVSLIEPARPPLKPVKPKKMLNLVLAVFLGTFSGLGLAFFMECLDDKIEKVEDVETQLQLPVLASIPIFEQKRAGVSKA